MSLEEDVKELAFRVPGPPDESLPPGIAQGELAAFESRTGLVLPPDVRDWLQFSNGPCIGRGGLLGIRTQRPLLDIEEVLKLYPDWKNSGWIPVAGDGCGNYYVVDTLGDGGVYFVDTAMDATRLDYAVGSNIWRFLWFLLSEELGNAGWPFDEAYVLSKDPEISSCGNAPLPWIA